jgi:alkylphosphonate utilization operon protein PhnA
MPDIPACPKCAMENTYPDGDNYVCADCPHEWPIVSAASPDADIVVRDVNGNILRAGDIVIRTGADASVNSAHTSVNELHFPATVCQG